MISNQIQCLGISACHPTVLLDLDCRIPSNRLGYQRKSNEKPPKKINPIKVIHFPELASKKATCTVSVETLHLSIGDFNPEYIRTLQNIFLHIYHCQSLKKIRIDFMFPAFNISELFCLIDIMKKHSVQALQSLDLSVFYHHSEDYFPLDKFFLALGRMRKLKRFSLELASASPLSSQVFSNLKFAFKKLKKMQSLIFKVSIWNGMTPSILNELSESISNLTILKSLEIYFTGLRDVSGQVIKAFSHALEKLPALKALILTIRSSSISYKDLFDGISSLLSLTDLRLNFPESFSRKESDLISLIQVLNACRNLNKFHFDFNLSEFPQKKTLESLAKVFENQKNLYELFFQILKPEPPESFACNLFPVMLSNLKAIRNLKLELRFIDNKGPVKAFYKELGKLHSVESLELQASNLEVLFENGNLKLFSLALKNLAKLTKIKLKFLSMFPKITADEVQHFFETFSSLNFLSELQFNLFFSQGISGIFSKISKLQHLKSLGFANYSIKISEIEAMNIFTSISSMKNLEELRIKLYKKNLFSPDSIIYFSTNLSKMTALKNLTIDMRGDEDEKFLLEIENSVYAIKLQKFYFRYDYDGSNSALELILERIRLKSTENLVMNYQKHSISTEAPLSNFFD